MPSSKIGGPRSSPPRTLQAEVEDEQPIENPLGEPLPAGVDMQPGKSRATLMGWGNNRGLVIDDPDGDQSRAPGLSAEYVRSLLGDKRIGELAVKLAFDIFTENRVDSDALDAAWHPASNRTEMGTLTVSYRNVISLGEGFFLKKSATGGVVMTGDLGGEGLQTGGWSALTRLGAPRMGTQYPTTQIAGLAGVEASVWKRHDLGAGFALEGGFGTGADFPVGATGVGNLRGNGQLGLGTPGKLQFDVGVTGSLQWTLGKALSFPKGGGPIDGLAVTSYGQVTWTGNSCSSTVRVDMNALGARTPLGTLTFSWFF